MLQKLGTFLSTAALVLSSASVDAARIHMRVYHDKQTTSTPSTMKPVRSIQARVQSDAPLWDATNKRYVSSIGKTFEEQYRAAIDTVNLASVEGALMYVQAEGINLNHNQNCVRKNNMTYVVFYDITIVQPPAAMQKYQSEGSSAALEYCPFVAMDGGQCTPAGTELPSTCNQYVGEGGQPKLGFCVGGEQRETEYRAPYPGAYWFSYPNACPTKKWKDKDDACRSEQAGGLCAPGVAPDGVTCTFSYKIMGYVKIDDIVGISSMTNEATGKPYANYADFCNAGGVEYRANDEGGSVTLEDAIAFWQNPTDKAANSKRFKQMVHVYNQQAKNATTKQMYPLPSVKSLTKNNPKCYENELRCANAPNGCSRTLYSQICKVCDAPGAGCEKKL